AYDIAQQLKSGSIALDREVQALFDTWKGSAADAYREGWDDMQDGAMLVRADGRVVAANPAAAMLLGVPQSAFVGSGAMLF
ncbi:WXG100 family type VII secretion target, partial [Mycobacterium tuberculosis]|nr:WXG100 family type VII secretion target [Mycobacterium tuberculosis]